MSRRAHGRLSPAFSTKQRDRRQRIIDWWTALEMSGDAGATDWEVLDDLRDCVTQYLGFDPLGLDEAERATAKAMILVSGLMEF
jgi:hypothetical protein